LLLKIYWSMFMGVYVLLLAYPPLVYFFTGEKVLMITIVIPGVDPFSYWGYIVHYALHSLMTLLCLIGTPIGDFYFMLNVAHVYIYSEFLNLKVKEFNEFLLAHHDGLSDSSLRRTLKTLFNELIVEQLHYADYNETLSGIFIVNITLHMGTATFSLAIALFILYTVSRKNVTIDTNLNIYSSPF
jgi:7tm Odorant receptor